MENIYAERIGAIRNFMKERGIDAMVISGSDPSQQRISGFTLEAGGMGVRLHR